MTEQKKAYNKEYYERNKERLKQKSRDWHKKNHDQFLKRKKKYNAAHAVERNEKQKAYTVEHREEIQKYFQGYYSKKGDKIREHVNKMKKVKIGELENELKKLFPNLVCHFCGERNALPRLGVHFHKKDGEEHDYHTIPKLRYIIAHPDEFITLCGSCHHGISHMMLHGLVWEELDLLITNKRREIGEEKLKFLKERMLKRLRRNSWMKKKQEATIG